MKSIANIWMHPKTSISGLLIAAATVAGVLSQQGVTLGKAGTGTVVTLAGALATALLGLVAKDPGSSASQQSGHSAGLQSKLGAWMLIALLVQLTWTAGCSGTSAARNIVNWTPSLQSAVATVDVTGAELAPRDAAAFSQATAGFDAASNLLVTQAKAYLANPSAATLAQLQTQVVTFQQQVNTALLQAAKIVDSASQQRALTSIQAVATAVTAILALVQSASSKTQVASMAAAAHVKLAQVRPYINNTEAANLVASHYDEPVTLGRIQVAQVEHSEMRAGF